MPDQYSRTRLLLGSEGVDRLRSAHVALFGLGGVGSWCAEALARAGVGELHLFDKDTVSLTNINRQAVALHSTVGLPKVEVMRARIADINPDCRVVAHQVFYTPENADEYDLSAYDYIADAIDTIGAKVELICRAKAAGTPIICAMGAGNKLDPTAFKISDIYKSEGCPLARSMRYELKKQGVKKLKCLYSAEKPIKPQNGKVGSAVFVTGTAGLIIAGEVIKDLLDK